MPLPHPAPQGRAPRLLAPATQAPTPAAAACSFFKRQQRLDAQTDLRVAELQRQLAALSPVELAATARAVDARVAALEASRDLSCTWLHVDMDAFFAACEVLDRPELAAVPFAVGGMGMISTANYEARRRGRGPNLNSAALPSPREGAQAAAGNRGRGSVIVASESPLPQA